MLTTMMNKHICKICKEEVEFGSHFWRTHKMREEEYYKKYFPKYSKLTGEPIVFKNRDFYMNSDFNDRNEMKAWFKANPQEAKDYAVELLKKRKEDRGLTYAMTEVELRSLGFPTPIWYNKVFGNYESLCGALGFVHRLSYSDSLPSGPREWPKKERIFIDTREKSPLSFDRKTEVKMLRYGDYTTSSKFNNDIFIERKSLSDFVNTMGLNIDRFKREIERAGEAGSYLFILVESSFSHAMGFNYLPHMKYATKSTPDYIFRNVRELLQQYKHIQFVFVAGRAEAAAMVKKIYTYGDCIKDHDVQYLLDMKKFPQ